MSSFKPKWPLVAVGIGLALTLLVYWAPFLALSSMQREDRARWPAAPDAIPALEAPRGQTERLRSPDGSLEFILIADTRAPVYEIRRQGRVVLAPSRIGFSFANGELVQPNLRIEAIERNEVRSTWEQPWGEARYVDDHHNEMAVAFADNGGARRFVMRVRAFDDGVGFRFEFPAGQERAEQFLLREELTEFRLGGDWRLWWTPAWSQARDETLTRDGLFSQLIRDEDARALNTPLTIEADNDLYLSIHESNLQNYAGMALAPLPGNVLRAQLTPWADGVAVRTAPPATTPWRTIQVGRRPVDLANSRLILNLADPPTEQIAFAQPGKYIGVWWGFITHQWARTPGDNYGARNERVRAYIDFAAAHGFDGVLVESWNRGWENWPGPDGRNFSFTDPYPEFDLTGLAQYARARGVRLVGHHETSGDIAHYEEHLDAGFALYRERGVEIIKTGFVARQPGLRRLDEAGRETREWHYGQFMVEHERRVAERAAHYGLSLIQHEAIKDTGQRRTFPNLLSRESARGQEYGGFDAVHGGNPPAHEATLAFTRLLAGPMDYTPGIFDLDFSEMPGAAGLAHRTLVRARVNTTLAKQLALYVIVYSPMQMAADFIENYERAPEAFAFIEDVPTDWEQSIALDGEIGEFAVIARQRRGGRDWYIGAVTDARPRTLRQSLDFLEPGVAYEATIWADAGDAHWRDNPEAFAVERRIVRRGDILDMALAAGGGQAVRLRPNVEQ